MSIGMMLPKDILILEVTLAISKVVVLPTARPISRVRVFEGILYL